MTVPDLADWYTEQSTQFMESGRIIDEEEQCEDVVIEAPLHEQIPF